MESKESTGSLLFQTGSKLFGSYVMSYITISLVLFAIVLKVFKPGNKNGRSSKRKVLGLESLPGPWGIEPFGIVGALPWLLPFEKSISIGLKWCETYGDLATGKGMNRTWVGINSAPMIQALLKSNDIGHLTKSKIYDLMKPFIRNGVLFSRGELWQHRRKAIVKSQSYQSVKAYMPRLNLNCKNFVSGLDEIFKDGKHHQINDLINSSFIKVIAEMITGFCDDESDEYAQYHHNFQIWKESTAYRVFHPWLTLDFLWKLHPYSKKANEAVEKLSEFARRRYREHKHKEQKEKGDAEENSDPTTPKRKWRTTIEELIDAGVDEDDIVDEINTVMLGGHETGATSIHIFFFLMSLHPEIQQKCQKEIDEFFEDPSLFKNGTIDYETASSNLKYLERCLMETLRLYPPVFIFVRELLTPLELNHNGQDYLIPVGSNMIIFPYGLHRKPEYFPDPERFDPDRFLPEEISKRHPYCYIPFSNGARNCLGLKLGMVEMKMYAAYTLRYFSMTTTDKMGDIPMLPFITATPAKDYTFLFKRRNS